MAEALKKQNFKIYYIGRLPADKVESLVRATKEMEHANHRLEANLKASKHEINQLQENLETVRNESLTDPLTSLANRKYFDQALEKAIAEAAVTGRSADK